VLEIHGVFSPCPPAPPVLVFVRRARECIVFSITGSLAVNTQPARDSIMCSVRLSGFFSPDA